MSSTPPSKRPKLRQASIMEGFKRQISSESGASTTGNPKAACPGTSSRADNNQEVESKGKQKLAEKCTQNVSEEKAQLREKMARAAEERKETGCNIAASTDNKSDSKVTSLDLEKLENQATRRATPGGSSESVPPSKPDGVTKSAAPLSPDGTEDDPDSQTQEYDSSLSLFDEDLEALAMEESLEVIMTPPSDGVTLGVPIEILNRLPECQRGMPPLPFPNNQHRVLVQVPLKKGEIPKPFPKVYRDHWDNHHVKMPCSKENIYPVGKTLKNRWELIQESLKNNILSSLDLEDSIIKYNTRYSQKWDFSGLHSFFTDVLDHTEANEFFTNVLPKLVNLALSMPEICTQALPLLKQQQNQSVTLSQQQAACLLANAFFCTFPRRNAHGRQSEYATYPDINFNRLFMGSKQGVSPRKSEKLKCILNYFRRVTSEMPRGMLTFRRQVLKDFPKWQTATTQLTPLHVTSEGTIEDNGQGMLQVDFANKFIGGGVLGFGSAQEEIRFLINPEMILSRLFTQMLEENECLIMIGCEQFSKYTGYSNTFKWAGNHVDTTERDEWGRRCVQVVAIDAEVINNYNYQFQPGRVIRELNKAYCGFTSPGSCKDTLPAVATGNWGCGAFGGDLKLKALIQLMAAAEAGRAVTYFTFNNVRLAEDLFKMHEFIKERELSISNLVALIKRYYNEPCRKKQQRPRQNLFEFIFNVCSDSVDDIEDAEESFPATSTDSAPPASPDWAANTP